MILFDCCRLLVLLLLVVSTSFRFIFNLGKLYDFMLLLSLLFLFSLIISVLDYLFFYTLADNLCTLINFLLFGLMLLSYFCNKLCNTLCLLLTLFISLLTVDDILTLSIDWSILFIYYFYF